MDKRVIRFKGVAGWAFGALPNSSEVKIVNPESGKEIASVVLYGVKPEQLNGSQITIEICLDPVVARMRATTSILTRDQWLAEHGDLKPCEPVPLTDCWD